MSGGLPGLELDIPDVFDVGVSKGDDQTPPTGDVEPEAPTGADEPSGAEQPNAGGGETDPGDPGTDSKSQSRPRTPAASRKASRKPAPGEPVQKVKRTVTISVDGGHWERLAAALQAQSSDGFKTNRSELVEVLIDNFLPADAEQLRSLVREHRTRYEG